MYDEQTGQEHPPISNVELVEYLEAAEDKDIRQHLNHPEKWGDVPYGMVVSEAEIRGIEVE